MEFHGRHIVVTGAANGIGRALARRFHAEGARVVASDRDPHGLAAVVEELNRDRADSAIEFPVDIGTESGNRDLVAAAEAAFGPIDLFFANAGVAVGTDLETTEADWELAFNVNVHGVEIVAGSRLATILGTESIGVNSMHHQVIERLGPGVRAVAHNHDGHIEAIELDDAPAVLGVQWHPEWMRHRTDHLALFEDLVRQVNERRRG